MNLLKFKYLSGIGVITSIIEEACNTKIGTMTTRIGTLRKISIKDVITDGYISSDTYYDIIDTLVVVRNKIVHAPLLNQYDIGSVLLSIDKNDLIIVLYKLSQYSNFEIELSSVHEACSSVFNYLSSI